MSLNDFSYIAGLGYECATTWQIMRATASRGIDSRRCSGPFDWVQLDPDQVAEAVASGFKQFFDPTTVQVDGALNQQTWKITSNSGVSSWHHLPVRPAELVPGAWSWFQFGIWLGERIAFWNAAVKDPAANILFVRAADPTKPDSDVALQRMLDALSKVVAGRFRLAAISYERPLREEPGSELCDPQITRFAVERPWPEDLPVDSVDWNRDYGRGIAWRGSTASWDKVWSAV